MTRRAGFPRSSRWSVLQLELSTSYSEGPNSGPRVAVAFGGPRAAGYGSVGRRRQPVASGRQPASGDEDRVAAAARRRQRCGVARREGIFSDPPDLLTPECVGEGVLAGGTDDGDSTLAVRLDRPLEYLPDSAPQGWRTIRDCGWRRLLIPDRVVASPGERASRHSPRNRQLARTLWEGPGHAAARPADPRGGGARWLTRRRPALNVTA